MWHWIAGITQHYVPTQSVLKFVPDLAVHVPSVFACTPHMSTWHTHTYT